MKSIQLLGIRGNHDYEIWKGLVEEVISDFSEALTLEEINSVDEIVRSGLDAIPALLMDDEVVMFQNNHLPSAAEVRNAINDFLIKKRRKMKKIIVPTDFSKTAQEAFQYAKALAGHLGNSLQVIHVCHPSTDSIDGVTAPMMDDLLASRKKKLEKLISLEKMKEGDVSVKTQIETEAVAGFAMSEIIERSKSEDTEMIVMGTTGERNVLVNILGSVSTGVSQKAHCPVWLVPPKEKFNGINNILYACNYESADDTVVVQAAKLAAMFGSMIHFVHVNEKNESEDFSETEGKIFDRLFAEGEPDFPFQMKSVNSASVLEGLNTYTEKENIDLVVIANRQRSFWESLTGQSMTKKMTLHIKKPILVYHL